MVPGFDLSDSAQNFETLERSQGWADCAALQIRESELHRAQMCGDWDVEVKKIEDLLGAY